MTNPTDFAHLLARTSENIWEAQWCRADLAKTITDTFSEEEVRQIGLSAGISHRDIQHWAALATRFPVGARRQEYSVRAHQEWFNLGLSDPGIDEWVAKKQARPDARRGA